MDRIDPGSAACIFAGGGSTTTAMFSLHIACIIAINASAFGSIQHLLRIHINNFDGIAQSTLFFALLPTSVASILLLVVVGDAELSRVRSISIVAHVVPYTALVLVSVIVFAIGAVAAIAAANTTTIACLFIRLTTLSTDAVSSFILVLEFKLLDQDIRDCTQISAHLPGESHSLVAEAAAAVVEPTSGDREMRQRLGFHEQVFRIQRKGYLVTNSG